MKNPLLYEELELAIKKLKLIESGNPIEIQIDSNTKIGLIKCCNECNNNQNFQVK